MTSWVRGNCTGKGAFGTVSVGIDRWDGRVFAVKSVDLKMGLPAQVNALENEIRILRQVSPSPYVVEFLGDDFTTSYRNLHMEYMPGGTLADLASRNVDVDEDLVRYYTWCLVNALRHVHSQGVVHCDVKGRNVLLGPNGCVAKLADFGSAVEFSGEECPAAVLPRGSPLWMAPEVIRGEYQGPESDVWSLGCTVIEMVNGKPAWEDHGGDTIRRIGYSDDLPEFSVQCSELARDFLEKCLRREPKQRWSCDQLLQHPFLSSASPNKPVESSPRCILDWNNNSEFAEDDEVEKIRFDNNAEASAKERIRKLATTLSENWETQGWVAVRGLTSEAEATVRETGDGGSGSGDEAGTNSECSRRMGAEEEMKVGTSGEYSRNVGRANRGKWEWDGKLLLVWRCDHREGNERGKLAGRSGPYMSENVDLHLVPRIKVMIGIIQSLCCKLFISCDINPSPLMNSSLLCSPIIYFLPFLLYQYVPREWGYLCLLFPDLKYGIRVYCSLIPGYLVLRRETTRYFLKETCYLQLTKKPNVRKGTKNNIITKEGGGGLEN